MRPVPLWFDESIFMVSAAYMFDLVYDLVWVFLLLVVPFFDWVCSDVWLCIFVIISIGVLVSIFVVIAIFVEYIWVGIVVIAGYDIVHAGDVIATAYATHSIAVGFPRPWFIHQ